MKTNIRRYLNEITLYHYFNVSFINTYVFYIEVNMKVNILLKTTIIIGIITIILVCIAIPKIDNIKAENELLQNEVKRLELQLNLKGMQLSDTQQELTGLYQEVEHIYIELIGSTYYQNDLRYRLRVTEIWADMAEFIFMQNGFEFSQIVSEE